MAKRVVEVLTDDIDGKELKEGEGQTVAFSVGNASYEVDLSQKNLDKFYDVLTPNMENGRKVSGGRRSRGSAPASKGQLSDIRAWAAGQGLEVSSRGRISREVRDAYDAAH